MYIDIVVKMFRMEDLKKGFIPMRNRVQISMEQLPKILEDKELIERIPYASIIGSIMYDVICTRPNVEYTLSVTSRF